MTPDKSWTGDGRLDDVTGKEITVVIPAYNEARLLRACLNAPGLRVTKGAARIVVADNGSSDDTVGIARECGAEVVRASRRGAAAARNAGIATADTEYIAFIDADCVAREGWLDELYRALSESSHAGVGGRMIWRARRARAADFYNLYYKGNAVVTREQPSMLQTSNSLFRRSVLDEVNGFCSAVRWCEDVEFCIRIGSRGHTFGYTHTAVADSWAPDTVADQLFQYYHYGVGIEDVRARHPAVLVDRPIPGGWWTLVKDALPARQSSRKPHGSRKLFMEAAYHLGRLHGKSRRHVREARLAGQSFLKVHDSIGGSGGQNRACITIEGGPSGATCGLLEALRRHGATASFFVHAGNVTDHAKTLDVMVREGHDVYASSWSGERFDTLSRGDINRVLHVSAATLRNVTRAGIRNFVQLPYGAGLEDPYVHEAVARWDPSSALVHWTLDTMSWKFARQCRSLEDVTRASTEALGPVLRSPSLLGGIVLFHDPSFRTTSPLHEECVVAIFDRMLTSFRAAGIETVRLSDTIGTTITKQRGTNERNDA